MSLPFSGISLSSLGSVSYTHLDVYKRQVYGISGFSLAQDIGVSRQEASDYMEKYLETFSGVRAYMDRVKEQAKKAGYVATLLGRRRWLPELKSSNYNLRSFGERVALNMPIQGTAADVMKLAMIRVAARDVYKRQVLETALRRAGATILGEETTPSAPLLTKADLFACGLSGGAGSREKRQALLRKLGLPAHLSPNAMLPVLSALYEDVYKRQRSTWRTTRHSTFGGMWWGFPRIGSTAWARSCLLYTSVVAEVVSCDQRGLATASLRNKFAQGLSLIHISSYGMSPGQEGPRDTGWWPRQCRGADGRRRPTAERGSQGLFQADQLDPGNAVKGAGDDGNLPIAQIAIEGPGLSLIHI